MKRAVFSLLLTSCLISCVLGQDHFPTPIPTSEIDVHVENFATIPDSHRNLPPRLSVLATDPLGRLFVNDQRGPMYSIDSTGGEVTEYLDLRDYRTDLRLISTSEAGFQSFAFHPDFATTGADGFGRLYTIHSSSNMSTAPDFDPGGSSAFHTLLLEWRTDTPEATAFTATDPNQPYRELLRIKQPYGNHNAGLIAFNDTVSVGESDYGNLYISLGDGGSGSDPLDNGQDASNPLGAILRIDPLGSNGINGQYGIPADSVLAGDGDPNTLGEIYAYGLRNPQRFGWDTVTGNMFIADIGQDAVEEINLGANGANFGWDDREGSFRHDSNNIEGLIDPVAEYDHTRVVSDLPAGISTGRAVTVGEVARGTTVPGLDGHLLLSDFPTGLLFTLNVDTDALDGGQDGLQELRLLNSNDEARRMLELINETRADRGLSSTNRADVRFGINTPGEVFITNKHDGIVRRLVAGRVGDCNGDSQLSVDDFACVLTVGARDAILAAMGGLPGDLDGDGNVAFSDFLILSANFGNDEASYAKGNVNLRDGVDFADFLVLSSNFVGQTPGATTSVPEPVRCPAGTWFVALLVARYGNSRRRILRNSTGAPSDSRQRYPSLG